MSFIPIEGAVNLRDFGGYPTKDAKTVKRGLLYRCGTMAEIPEHAHDDFAELNISVICDLRSHEEAESSPTPDVGPFRCRVHIPIWPGSSTQFQETVRDRPPSQSDFIEFMRTVTREIARDHVHAYQELMKHLLEADNGFLLHCSAGKDRTGFGAAVILAALGVSKEHVTRDYLMSNEASELVERTLKRMSERANEQKVDFKPDDRIVRVLAGVQEDYLTGAFEEIEREFGGVPGYLEALGLTANEIETLRQKLLQ